MKEKFESAGIIVKDFLLVANEYCMLMENMTEYSKKELLEKTQKILALLYIKTSILPVSDDNDDLYVEKFVQEEDWQFIQNGLAGKLGIHETFFDVFTPETQQSDNYESLSLSEGMTDIYQDLKDIVTLYQLGNEESLESGLFDCKINFERYWGPRLLALLSVIHNIIYCNSFLEEEDKNTISKLNSGETPNTDNWLINKRFDGFNN